MLGLSLLSPAKMVLTTARTARVVLSEYLPVRSLYVMGGSSWTHYCHGVVGIESRRISLTIRTLATK